MNMQELIYVGLVAPTGDDAQHYGVKGMKWGVRRSIGKASREAYRVKTLKAGHDKFLKKKEKKLADAKAYGGKTKKLQYTVNKGRAINKKYANRYDALTKGMSTKDLKKGARAVKGRDIASGILLGPLGAVGVTAASLRTNKRAMDG